MDKDLIKRELDRQKPIADFNYEREGFKNYSTELVIEGFEEIIEFLVPLKDCNFEEVVPAQLLSKWLKI